MCVCERMNTACKKVLVVLRVGLMAWCLVSSVLGGVGYCVVGSVGGVMMRLRACGM